MNRQDLYFEPETYNSRRPNAPNRAPEPIKSRQALHLNGQKDFGEVDGVQGHFKNFIAAIQGKEKVIAPPTVGQQAAISGHMATLSYKNQKKVIWDESANKYHFA
jgi:hypothetical protein